MDKERKIIPQTCNVSNDGYFVSMLSIIELHSSVICFSWSGYIQQNPLQTLYIYPRTLSLRGLIYCVYTIYF